MIPPRNLDTKHLFDPPATRRQWEERAKELRERVLLATGLLPMPTRHPLQPRTTSTFEQDGIVVENVAIQTVPGFWLCGTVYRPVGGGPFPAIVNPHGHWTHGRKEREPDVREAAPAPAAPAPGKADLVSLAANLARQGFLVFAYDMVGYNETDQVRHRHFGTDLESWAWGISELGLQTWNSVRAVDYLAERKDVDANRIGATGASGGATQVFLLAAIDDRIQVSVPVNMVSAIMQGGCICENGPGLRVGTDNVEIAALFAPRPQLLVSCTGDWTRNLPREEGPTIRKVYELFAASSKLQWVQFNYQHNYNLPSREAVSAFFRRWLMQARPEAERSVAILPERLVVQRPAGIDEDSVRRWLRDEGSAATVRLRERGGAAGRELLRTALRLSLSVETPSPRRATDSLRPLLIFALAGNPRAHRVRYTPPPP
ncbi:MAG: alpha/beta hydrolase family protein, partial [Armatimonadota bacterium]